MKKNVSALRIIVLLGAVILATASCNDSKGDPPVPAPDFSLVDTNADSPTYGETRSPAASGGRVLVLHFVLYT